MWTGTGSLPGPENQPTIGDVTDGWSTWFCRVALASLAFLLLVSPATDAVEGEPLSSRPLTPVRLILHWRHQAQFAGFYCAREAGLYAKEGLDVLIASGGPGRSSEESLLIGQSQFATFHLGSALKLRSQQIPVRLVAQTVNRSNLMIVAWKNSGMTRIEDLNGRKLSAWEGLLSAPVDALFRARRIRPKTVLPQFYSVQLFLKRAVDACMVMNFNELHRIYQAGVEPDELVVFDLGTLGFGFPEDGLYALDWYVRDNPKITSAMVRASLEGWKLAAADPETALDHVMKYVREDRVPANRAHMRWMLKTILPSIIPSSNSSFRFGELNRADFLRTVTLLEGEGLIKAPPQFESFVEGQRAP